MRDFESRERIAVTLSRRVNLGNYESADASICLSGIEPGATEEQIADMLGTAKLAWSMIGSELNHKIHQLKAEAARNGGH